MLPIEISKIKKSGRSEAEWNGRAFHIVDTGGIDPSAVSARKEPLSVGSADYVAQIRGQAELAIREADVVVVGAGIAGVQASLATRVATLPFG